MPRLFSALAQPRRSATPKGVSDSMIAQMLAANASASADIERRPFGATWLGGRCLGGADIGALGRVDAAEPNARAIVSLQRSNVSPSCTCVAQCFVGGADVAAIVSRGLACDWVSLSVATTREAGAASRLRDRSGALLDVRIHEVPLTRSG